ncbi:hypothetical protein M4R22_18525 [Acidovorax sp. GBBC 3334]|uniref:hypothetical protein n=1 Tax=Acidovorax sp. GBBC 3334 TaxID=2940496 RepID=UPI00230301C0|nr:hypothetical protein [Acidovorax sp. GBBC 3334]MDA8456760.1 hypothetical protein [Acidovorax sp. GBBC 3334]
MPKSLGPLAWWKRMGCGLQLLLIFLLLIAAYTAWWWIDSARTCDTQDDYNLRGICLMRIQERAEQGDNAAQWAYGSYLERSAGNRRPAHGNSGQCTALRWGSLCATK